jgi:hypothetical protein
MAFDLKNMLFRFFLKTCYPPGFSAKLSANTQQRLFSKLLKQLSDTEIGKDTGLNTVKSYNEFRKKIQVTQYDYYEPYIEKIKAGQQKVMTAHRVRYFGKTAGTTSGKSKLIPITRPIIRHTHTSGTFFGLSRIHALDKKVDILNRKNFILSGGMYEQLQPSGIWIGDISAIMMWNVPLPFRTIYVPDLRLITQASWESKINQVVQQVAKADIGTISGIPTWHLAVLSKIRAQMPFDSVAGLWKNLKIFFHGGVSFEPYKKHFTELLGRSDFIFYEVYNATEGFFGIQATLESGDLLLLTDNGVFYEFIPFSLYSTGVNEPIPLTEVKASIPYVLVITTFNGLLRYVIGDVITFTRTDPYQFRITGRTQEYINAFGEDLLLSNVQQALMKTNANFDCVIKEYTVAPLYISIGSKGRMQFLIEFIKAPGNIQQYAEQLDTQLQKENSNYAQKRTNDLALTSLEIIEAKDGLFYQWMQLKGKMGGQNKVPRLVNNRNIIEEILALADKKPD